MATLSSQVKSHEHRDSRREEENAGLLMMKEEQRRKVQNKGSKTDVLNIQYEHHLHFWFRGTPQLNVWALPRIRTNSA